MDIRQYMAQRLQMRSYQIESILKNMLQTLNYLAT